MPAVINILVLETSTEHLSVAVTSGETVFARDCVAGQRHSELLLPMIASVLADAGLQRNELHAVAFGAGPGSFTGLRIACGTAQGLAFGLGVPVIPVPTLEAVAESVAAPRVLVAADARMGELYCAVFEQEPYGWRVIVEAGLYRPDQPPAISGNGWVGAGSGFIAHADALGARYGVQLSSVLPDALPHARTIAALARVRYGRGLTVPAAAASPIYIRDKVALTIREQAASR